MSEVCWERLPQTVMELLKYDVSMIMYGWINDYILCNYSSSIGSTFQIVRGPL